MKSRVKRIEKYVQSMSLADKIILIVALIGVLVRIIYIIGTNYDVRQHDSVEFEYNEGHLAYIWYWFEHRMLPDFDPRQYWQFYQPPLHHILAAIWLKINLLVGFDLMTAIENIQILTSFYSCMAVYFSYKIFKELGIKGKGLVLAFTIVCLHPTLIMMSGSINNDILCIMIGLAVMLATLKWYKNPSMKKIIVIAVLLGLSMMAKTSGVLLAPAIAFVFISKFAKDVLKLKQLKQLKKITKATKENGISEIENTEIAENGLSAKVGRHSEIIATISQFIVFICISVPIGMWWSIYNNVRFKVPFGYVPKLPKELDQYIGGYSVWSRFFDFNPVQFSSVFENWGRPSFEHNIIIAIMKTSMFGEYNFSQTTNITVIPATIAFWANAVLIVLSVTAMVYVGSKRIEQVDNVIKMFFGLVYAVVMGSFIKFCFEFAHTCTMDFRYIVPTMVIGAIAIGIFVNELEKKERAVSEKVIVVVEVSVVFLAVFSVLTYCILALAS